MVKDGVRGEVGLNLVRQFPVMKKSSASSKPAKLTSMTSEDMRNRKWSEAEKEAVRRGAAAQGAGDDSGIDYSDIPQLRGGAACGHGPAAGCEAEGSGERASRSAGARLAARQG